jgi:hypothetical protein
MFNTIECRFQAITHYTTSDCVVNNYYRGVNKNPDLKLIKELKKELFLLRSPEPIYTYRGCKSGKPHNGFISTSISPTQALRFGDKVIKIWGYGSPIWEISTQSCEKEVLYPPSTWVEIQGVWVQEEFKEEFKLFLKGKKKSLMKKTLIPLKKEVEGLRVVEDNLHFGFYKPEKLEILFVEKEVEETPSTLDDFQKMEVFDAVGWYKDKWLDHVKLPPQLIEEASVYAISIWHPAIKAVEKELALEAAS